MPRKHRYAIPGTTLLVVQSARKGEQAFFDEGDYEVYLDAMRKASELFGCNIHAYALLEDQVYILVTPSKDGAVSRFMQRVGIDYIRHVNNTYDKSGSVWSGRFKSALIGEKRYIFDVMQYIESIPVRRNLVSSAAKYPWTSRRTNVLGKVNTLITPHPSLLGKGSTSYKEQSKKIIDKGRIEAIDRAWKSSTYYGSQKFLTNAEKELGAKIGHSRPGRPPKEANAIQA